jgi:hypothetical protein
MVRKECVDIILYECIATNGFITNLRGREFSQESYDRLKTALTQYREMIRDEEFIERSVASCLHFLDIALLGAMENFPRTEKEEILIINANNILNTLLTEILTPEYMTRETPPEFE